MAFANPGGRPLNPGIPPRPARHPRRADTYGRKPSWDGRVPRWPLAKMQVLDSIRKCVADQLVDCLGTVPCLRTSRRDLIVMTMGGRALSLDKRPNAGRRIQAGTKGAATPRGRPCARSCRRSPMSVDQASGIPHRPVCRAMGCKAGTAIMPGNPEEFKFAGDLNRRCTVLLSFARHSTYLCGAVTPGERACSAFTV